MFRFRISQLVSLILAFTLGFSCAGGIIVGGVAIALSSFTVMDIEKHGILDIPDEMFRGDNYEVDFLDLTAFELIEEIQKLQAMGDKLTINELQKRYDLKIDEKANLILTDELRDMPLKQAFSKEGLNSVLSTLYIGRILGYSCVDITTGEEADPSLGDELTKWIKSETGEDVTGIQAVLAFVCIGDFTSGEFDFNDILDGIVIGDALGYTYDEESDKWFDSNGDEVVGVMAAFAGLKITEVGSEINNIKIGTLLGYSYDEETEIWSDGDGPLSGFMKVLADCTMDTVGEKIEDATLGDLLGYYYDQADGRWEEDAESNVPLTGFMKVLAPCTMDNVGETIETALLGDFFGYYYDEADGRWEEDNETNVPLTGLMKVLAPCTMDNVGDKIEESLLGDLLGYYYDETDSRWEEDAETNKPVTGFMKVLADSTMETVGDNIEDAQLGDLLGYQKIGGEWHHENELGVLEPVDGFMSAIADEKLDSIGDAFDKLTIGDIVDEEDRTGIFAILKPETEITNIAGAINDSIMESPMQFFMNEGLITFDSETQGYLDLISSVKDTYIQVHKDSDEFKNYYEGKGSWAVSGSYYSIPEWRTKPLSESFGYIVSLLAGGAY